jgi:hypothetical protein
MYEMILEKMPEEYQARERKTSTSMSTSTKKTQNRKDKCSKSLYSYLISADIPHGVFLKLAEYRPLNGVVTRK